MKFALILSLICSLPVLAQVEPDPQVVQGLNIAQERNKLSAMRQQIDADFSTAKKACYQKIAVNACLDRARQVKNQQDNEHKRLSLVVNEADRKQRGANAVKRTDDKLSPDKQAEREDERIDRLNQQLDALDRNADKNAKQQEKRDAVQKNLDERTKHVQEVLDRQQKHQEKLKSAEQARTNHQRKLEEAQQHRAQVQKDNASRERPAAPLPPLSNTTP